MSFADDVARLLTLGGVDGTALTEVISDYFCDPEDNDPGIHMYNSVLFTQACTHSCWDNNVPNKTYSHRMIIMHYRH